MLVVLYPGNALTTATLTSRFSFTEWLKEVWHHSLTAFDEKTPSPSLSGKEQLPYFSERGIPTCPASRKLGQSSRNLWSLLSSNPSYWSERKRKIKNNITRVSALCWPLFFNNNLLRKKLHHCNAGHVLYNTTNMKCGGCLLFQNKVVIIILIFILIKYIETRRTFPLCHCSYKAIFLSFHT